MNKVERHENGRKVRSDKGKSRCCANCSAYESFPDEYGIYMGGACLMKNERTSSVGWCNHWRRER